MHYNKFKNGFFGSFVMVFGISTGRPTVGDLSINYDFGFFIVKFPECPIYLIAYAAKFALGEFGHWVNDVGFHLIYNPYAQLNKSFSKMLT